MGFPRSLEAKHVGLAVPLWMPVVILRKSFLARYEVTETLTVAVAPDEKLPALCHLQINLHSPWVTGCVCPRSTSGCGFLARRFQSSIDSRLARMTGRYVANKHIR